MGKREQYKVIVSDRARQMLAGHVRFMAQKSPSAARKMKKELMDAIRCLQQMPERFPFLEAELSRRINITRCLSLILYLIKDQTVYVDYIVDCRQDYGWLVQ